MISWNVCLSFVQSNLHETTIFLQRIGPGGSLSSGSSCCRPLLLKTHPWKPQKRGSSWEFQDNKNFEKPKIRTWSQKCPFLFKFFTRSGHFRAHPELPPKLGPNHPQTNIAEIAENTMKQGHFGDRRCLFRQNGAYLSSTPCMPIGAKLNPYTCLRDFKAT